MWHAIFDLPVPVAEKVLRAVLIYVFLIVGLRVVGKRELGQTNTLDFVVLLLVANAVQNGIIGDDLSVTGAFIGAAVLFAVNELFNRGTYEFPWLSRVLEGTPTVLIAGGEPRRRALRSAGISLSELNAIARHQGFRELGEVGTAILETNGVISMFATSQDATPFPSR